METKIIGSLLVMSLLLLAIAANRPRILTERSDRNLTAIEHRAMRYFGLVVKRLLATLYQ